MLKNAKEISEEVFGGKISEWQILYYTRNGKIPYVMVGRRKFFKVDEVLQAMRRHENINSNLKKKES